MITGEPIDWSDERIEELAEVSDEDVIVAREWGRANSRLNFLLAEPSSDDDADFETA